MLLGYQYCSLYIFKNLKKTHSFNGAAQNIPNSLQAIDLGLG